MQTNTDTSSCQSASEAFRTEREAVIRQKVREFLHQVGVNLSTPEGISGHLDLALKIDRRRIIGEEMTRIGKELQDGP